MPNLCSNDLYINGDKNDVLEFYEFMGLNLSAEFDFNKISPIPETLSDARKTDFCRRKWGVKLGATDTEIITARGHKYLTFNTIWTPPSIKLIRKLSTMFPKLDFTLEYFKSSQGFCGGYSFLSNERSEECYVKFGDIYNAWYTNSYKGRRGS
ncbi:MAG: Ferredoxin-like domain in Api92-like protein [Bacteroidota bacterium]